MRYAFQSSDRRSAGWLFGAGAPCLTLSVFVALALWSAVMAVADQPQAPSEPPGDEAARLAARIDKLHKKYGEDMLYSVDEKLKIVFVMGTDERSLAEVKQRLSTHAEALQRDLFKYGPKEYLSVIVPRKWVNPKITGHFYPDLVDASNIGCNLIHEFTHALHYADQLGRNQMQPVWLMEGFASMYESSEVVNGHVEPKLNSRLAGLQRELKDNKILPFAKMMGLEHRQFTSHHYAQANYMCLYLHATGKLPQWYAAYNEGFSADTSGVAATESIYGKNLDEIQKDWLAWVLQLVPPPLGRGPGAASMDIASKPLPDAVEIEQLTPKGAAAKAGLAVGDALIRVDDQRIIDTQDLVMALGRHQPGDSVKVESRRDGQYHETSVILSPLTSPPPAVSP
ncbi:MAG: PDZ domain-containing protein [Verrucomicrobiota bacterium]